MNHVPDTELFSAYLDGELTADEKLRVEQILAASPEAGQLLEELRAVGSALKSLPQAKLEEDLSARVLEVAERRMLLPYRPGDGDDGGRGGDKRPSAGRAAEAMKSPEADSAGWLGIPWREISWRGMLSKRALIWTAVVLATAIIISFTSPPPKPNRELARREAPPAASGPAGGEKSTGRAISDGSWEAVPRPPRKLSSDEKKLAQGEGGRTAGDGFGAAKDQRQDLRKADDGRADQRHGSVQLAMRDGTRFKDRVVEEKPADEAERLKPGSMKGESARRDSIAQQDKSPRPAAKKLPASPAAPLAAAKPALAPMTVPPPAKPPPAAVPGSFQPPALDVAKDAEGANSDAALGGGVAVAKKDLKFAAGEVVPSVVEEKIASKRKSGKAASQDDLADQGAPAETIVRCDISALAVQDKVFENLLGRQGLGNGQAPLNRDIANQKAANQDIAGEITGNRNVANRSAMKNAANGPLAEGNAAYRQLEQAGAGGGMQQQGMTANSGLEAARPQFAPSQSTASSGIVAQRRAPGSLIYRFEASPEQLAIILKLVRQRGDSFSLPHVESVAQSAPAADSPAANLGFGGNALGRAGRGASNERRSQRPAKADVDAANLSGQATAQSQAAANAAPVSQAAGPLVQAKQRVIFVFRVVDRLPPPAPPAKP